MLTLGAFVVGFLLGWAMQAVRTEQANGESLAARRELDDLKRRIVAKAKQAAPPTQAKS